MKRVFTALILCFMLISFASSAQNTKCECSVVYDDLVQQLEENYIGLAKLKTTNQNKEFEKRKVLYKSKAANTKSENCTKVLQQFLSYFDDGHLFAFELPKYSEKETERYKKKIKSELVSPDTILRTLKYERDIVEKNGLDGIIGKWTDGKSEFAIVKDEGFYKAYVISSTIDSIQPGELKALFTSTSNGFEGTYYSYGYAPRYIQGNIYKEGTLLVFTGANYWGKIGNENSKEISMINSEEVKLPVIQKLDSHTTLFSIPSFMVDYQKFNQVIFDNIELLKNTSNLIIDIRGNVGGNAIYFSFFGAFATRPMESSQGLVLASEQTKIYFENKAKNNPQLYNSVVERIRDSMGNIVDGPEYPERTFEPFESNIKNVAIVTDNGCMSAAESFIIHSKRASTIVKTFGQPTGGVIDYTSVNTLKLDSGDQNIYFGYPTSTLHKNVFNNGYNKTGIVPDVKIKNKVKDKIQFIIDYYKTE